MINSFSFHLGALFQEIRFNIKGKPPGNFINSLQKWLQDTSEKNDSQFYWMDWNARFALTNQTGWDLNLDILPEDLEYLWCTGRHRDQSIYLSHEKCSAREAAASIRQSGDRLLSYVVQGGHSVVRSPVWLLILTMKSLPPYKPYSSEWKKKY